MEKKEYLVPEYYEDFACKCGDCRASCCTGWGITVSMNEYFRLLGAEVSNDLRRKLDCGLKSVENPTPERFAKIGPGWDFRCPLLSEKGLCTLQTECGEGMLPEVCRIYPRTFRETYGAEASMSASCERVVELLFNMKEPLKFKKAMIFSEPCESMPAKKGLTHERYVEIRKGIIKILQDRRLSFPERIINMSVWLIGQKDIAQNSAAEYEKILLSDREADDYECFRLALSLLAMLGGRSESIRDYMEEALGNLGIEVKNEAPTDETLKKASVIYSDAKRAFEARYPDLTDKFEQVFVNHVFFTDFPWADIRETIADECAALGVTYITVKFLTAAYMMKRDKDEDLVDVTAACFRLIEHSAFDRSAANALMILESEHSVRFTDVIRKI
ncbi:MAG: flagellin lysine-N-methylase [Clostridia bacterium]|nr:flagellin lysine-N-methylase [Clostridia bacterium]